MARFLTVIFVFVATLLIYQNVARLFVPKLPKIEAEKTTRPIGKTAKAPKHITKTEVYKWVDDDGQVHFSDRTIKDDGTQQEKVVVTSEATEFKEVPKIRQIYIPSNRQTGNTSSGSRTEQCKRLKKQVAKEEERAKRRTSSYGQTKKLSDSRWKVIKNC